MKSMTGFGRGTAQNETLQIEVELRSVNHKGLDVKLRAPRELATAEAVFLRPIKSRIGRGRVDVGVHLGHESHGKAPRLDEAAADALLDQLRGYATSRKLPFDVGASELLRVREVFVTDDTTIDTDEATTLVLQALDEALTGLQQAREREGEALKVVLEGHVATSAKLVDAIDARLKLAPERFAERLREKIESLDDNITLDPARMAQEVAILADKVDVTEEVNRLHLHFAHARELMEAAVPVGRKLDFLCQEFLREANTVASKCQDAPAAHLVVELKAEVERLREQVQNVE